MFHRLTVPSYQGGLPGGYDYINNAVVGTPASANGVLGGGPNSGSYMVGFGDDATSANANRPHAALAENTDYLDDLFHRPIARTVQTGDVLVAGSVVTSRVITGGNIFIGAGTVPATLAGYNTLFEILDDEDNEIIGANGDKCQVTGFVASDGLLLNDPLGFTDSGSTVTLAIFPGIPVGVTYRIYYGLRTTLADLPMDALTNADIRSGEAVPSDLLAAGGAGKIGTQATGNWFDLTPIAAGTVQSQINAIVSGLAAASGAEKIGIDASVYGGLSLSAGSVADQVDDLLNLLNQFETQKAAASGLASLSASSRLVQLPLNAIVDQQYVTAPGTFTTSSGSLTNATGFLLTFSTAAAGDVLDCSFFGSLLSTNDATALLSIVVNDGGGDVTIATCGVTVPSVGGETGSPSGRHVVVTPGVVTVRARVAVSAGTLSVVGTAGTSNIRATLVRP